MKRGREKFDRVKPIINILVDIFRLLPRRIRVIFFERSRNVKGQMGILIRYILLKSIARHVGDNVAVFENVYIYNADNLWIGDNVSIHPMCYIQAKGGIKIEENVSIAHAVTILSVNHIYSNMDLPIKEQGIQYKKTIIKSNVWIGAKATILYGVSVGSGSIIAAGSVVNKNIENLSMSGGVPAKTIKYRNSN